MRKAIAALIQAVDYINFRTEEMNEEDDVRALEAIALQLSEMTHDEFKEFEAVVIGLKKLDWLQELMPGRYNP